MKIKIKLKRLTALIMATALLLCACLSLASCGDDKNDRYDGELLESYHYIRFDTDFGSMTFRLDADSAPSPSPTSSR